MNDALGDGISESRSFMSATGDSDDILWNGEDAVIAIEVMEAIPGLELYRARADVVGLVRHLTGRMGRVFDLKDGRIVVFFPLDRTPERNLYLHQLSQDFGDAYESLATEPEFPGVFLDWPGGRDALKQHLAVE